MIDDRQKLASENVRLAYMVAHKFKSCGIEFDDLIGICFLGLVKAANAYDPGKAQFTTFAIPVITNEVLCELRKGRRNSGFYNISIDSELEDGRLLAEIIPDNRDYFETIYISDMWRECLEKLSDKEKLVILLKVHGKKQNQISRQLQLSQPQISRIYRSAVKKIKAAIQC